MYTVKKCIFRVQCIHSACTCSPHLQTHRLVWSLGTDFLEWNHMYITLTNKVPNTQHFSFYTLMLQTFSEWKCFFEKYRNYNINISLLDTLLGDAKVSVVEWVRTLLLKGTENDHLWGARLMAFHLKCKSMESFDYLGHMFAFLTKDHRALILSMSDCTYRSTSACLQVFSHISHSYVLMVTE